MATVGDLPGTPIEKGSVAGYERLHAYSGRNPRGQGTPEIDEWLHLSKDTDDKLHGHAELTGDLRYVASHDFDEEDHIDLLLLDNDQYRDVFLDAVPDYVEWKNQAALFTWAWGLLKNAGTLTVRCRSMEAVLGKPRKMSLSRLLRGDDWEAAMRTLYSSGAPSDSFMCLHTRESLKRCLREAGFTGIRVRQDGSMHEAVARKVV